MQLFSGCSLHRAGHRAAGTRHQAPGTTGAAPGSFSVRQKLSLSGDPESLVRDQTEADAAGTTGSASGEEKCAKVVGSLFSSL